MLIIISVLQAAEAISEVSFTVDPMEVFTGDVLIPAEEGVTNGDNLFHSFDSFNIRFDESVTFTGPDGIARVIASVTGTGGTLIEGLLKSEINEADLYLINPNGVSVGKGAAIDLDGSLYLSTADKLTFSDGSELYVSPSGSSTLTSASPESFGFMDMDVAPIEFESALISNGSGSGVSLVGGEIRIQNSSIYVPDGLIQIVSLSGPADLKLDPGEGWVANGEALGRILIGNDADGQASKRMDMIEAFGMNVADLDVSGASGGRVHLVGDRLDMNASYIFADTLENGEGEGISIFVQSSTSLLEQSRITTDNLGNGMAGDINLRGYGTIRLADRSVIASDARGNGGGGGRISIQGDELVLESLAQIKTTSNTAGDGGEIQVDVESISFSSGGGIAGQTIGSGNGGDITLSASREILIDGVNLASGVDSGVSVSTLGSGDAGTISLSAPAITLRSGASIKAFSGGLTQISGAAGSIKIDSPSLRIESGSRIDASSFSSANAGNIEAFTNDLTIVGDGSGISTQTIGSGNGGTILLDTQNLNLEDHAELLVSTSAGGNAGEINIFASEAILRNSKIDAGTSGVGGGGAINISGNSLTISEGASIESNTASIGDAGRIQVDIAGALTIKGVGSAISSRSGLGDGGNYGEGGSISINAKTLLVTEESAIEATSSGTGFAGNIALISGIDVVISKGSVVRTNAERSGGGNIAINGVNTVYFDESSITASAGGENIGDDSGNISIDPVFLILRESSILAQADVGDGGAIFLSAENYISDNSSVVDASSKRGNDGEIEISSPDLDVTGSIGVLSADFSSQLILLRDPCAEKALQDKSSLIVRGKSLRATLPTSYSVPGTLEDVDISCGKQ